MSFDLFFWQADEPPETEEAAELFQRSARGETGFLGNSRAVQNFLAEVISVYGDLTIDHLDETPGPPWTAPIYSTPECVITTISWGRHMEVADSEAFRVTIGDRL